MSQSPADPARPASPDGVPIAIPALPWLPPPDVVARLLAALPAGPTRQAATAALADFADALAARWAADHYALVSTEPRARAESGAVHIFRMVDSGWRFARDPEAMRSLRRTLMPDGVGGALYRDWPAMLAWLRALVDALLSPVAEAARARHLGRMLDFFVEEVDAAAAVSPPLPAGGDAPVIAAGRILQTRLLDALEAFADAGGDLDRLVLGAREGIDDPSRGDRRPVEPDAGRPVVPPEATSEVEDADE